MIPFAAPSWGIDRGRLLSIAVCSPVVATAIALFGAHPNLDDLIGLGLPLFTTGVGALAVARAVARRGFSVGAALVCSLLGGAVNGLILGLIAAVSLGPPNGHVTADMLLFMPLIAAGFGAVCGFVYGIANAILAKLLRPRFDGETHDSLDRAITVVAVASGLASLGVGVGSVVLAGPASGILPVVGAVLLLALAAVTDGRRVRRRRWLEQVTRGEVPSFRLVPRASVESASELPVLDAPTDALDLSELATLVRVECLELAAGEPYRGAVGEILVPIASVGMRSAQDLRYVVARGP